MALKSGTSHAGATLLLTIIAAVLVQYLKFDGFFESVFKANEQIAEKIAKFAHLTFMINLPAGYIEYILVAVVLSFLWGIVYHYSRHC